jgi:hypothetical protein
MPTHRGGGLDRRDDPIRYRNLVRRMEVELRASHPAGVVAKIVSRFEPLVSDTGFWTDTLDGFAAFGSADFFATHRLPRAVPELLVINTVFHLKPLLRITQSAARFQVLGLTRTETFLWEGDRYGLDRFDTAGLIPTFDEAVGTDLTERERSKITTGARTTSTSHYSGQGARKDELDVDTGRFFREVARAVRENVSERSNLPLVLVALGEHQTEFRRHAHNPHLLPAGVPIDPGSLTPDKLLQEAWHVVEPRYLDRLARLGDDYGTAVARQKGSNQVADVARAGRDGRIGILLVDADRSLCGRLDPATGEVRLGEPDSPDLFDDMAEMTLRAGGEVVVVPHEKMPSQTGLAAIYRY